MGRPPNDRRLWSHPLFKRLSVANDRHGAASEMTMDTYHGRLTRLEDISGKPLDDALLHPKETYDSVSKKYKDSATTRKGMLTAVMALFAHSPAYAKAHAKAHKEWSLLHRMQAGIEAKKRNDNTITKEEREKMVTVSELERAARALKARGLKTAKESQDHLLMRFMTDVPPKRLDLGELLVCVSGKPARYKGNYVLVPARGECKLVLQQYKTAKAYGVITDVLPAGLATDLRASLRKFPRKLVFGAPMTASQYGVYIRQVCKEYTDKESGINDIRHAYISERCIASKVTISELQRIARSMGHNTDMQARYQLVGF